MPRSPGRSGNVGCFLFSTPVRAMSASILIVEDHGPSRQLLDFLLRARGYRTRLAGNGTEAMTTLEREPIDLVLCDLHMPVMDGYVFIHRLRADARFEALPVLAVTASTLTGDRDRVLAAGFTGFFSKPIDPEHFVEHMEAFLPPGQRAAG